MNAKQMREILDVIAEMFPDAHCELNHSNPFELTIAVLLSAQCTDETVNKVTAGLFEKYKRPEDYLSVSLEELQQDIKRIGLYRNKATHIQKMCRLLLDKFDGRIPEEHDKLTELPGVGRKTANVVMSNAFGVPAIAVDTHVDRVSKRLGAAKPDDSVLEVEKKLMKLVPRGVDADPSSSDLLWALPLQGTEPVLRNLSAAGPVQGRETAYEAVRNRKDKERKLQR